MKERPILFSGPMVRAILDGRKTQTRRVATAAPPFGLVKHRFGEPGDRLWVRERWSPCDRFGGEDSIRDAEFALMVDGAQKYSDGVYIPGVAKYAPDAFERVRWRPSIHMPRWASRITLEVTDVRVERLLDISEEDAKAEGVEPCEQDRWFGGMKHASAFGTLWDEINGKRAPWVSNPWVWVVSFRRVEP